MEVRSLAVPSDRVRAANRRPARPAGDWVVYWMTASRRVRHNFGLQRAVEHAVRLRRPLVVLEALRADYPWASARFHRFALDGMRDNAAALRPHPVAYYPYVEPAPGAGRGLLESLAARACVVVTDDFPEFFLPRMLAAAAARLRVRVEAVDGNGLVPIRAAGRAFPLAQQFRRFVQLELPDRLLEVPLRDPLAAAALVPLEPAEHAALAAIREWWPAASPALLAGEPAALRALPIDHEVGPVDAPGGAAEAERVLERFVVGRLRDYATQRNRLHPPTSSGLSPYLHWGHISPHRVLERIADHEGWTPDRAHPRPTGARRGWWGMGEAAEAFLDQLVVWRELGLNASCWLPEHRRYESLPGWARATLERHAPDPRPALYSREQLEAAETADIVWNAAQTELLRDGRIHNYLRMLWGKSVLAWSPDPREALDRLVALNDRWALDGRDPNSYAGVFWCFGRYDRPWPERQVFGTVRAMTSASTARKLDLPEYLRRYAPADPGVTGRAPAAAAVGTPGPARG